MTNYRRLYSPGSSWFFTVCLNQRRDTRLLVDHIDILRNTFRKVTQKHPFTIHAIVILPDHLHCIWTLPDEDENYSTRWSLIKAGFSRAIPKQESRTFSRIKRGEREIWQRRFWEHRIRDQDDYNRHVDYIHWNPVKHRHVRQVIDWPHSSFHRFVDLGIYPPDWGGRADLEIQAGE